MQTKGFEILLLSKLHVRKNISMSWWVGLVQPSGGSVQGREVRPPLYRGVSLQLGSRLIDWLIDWLNDWLIDWLNDWLIDWLILLIDIFLFFMGGRINMYVSIFVLVVSRQSYLSDSFRSPPSLISSLRLPLSIFSSLSHILETLQALSTTLQSFVYTLIIFTFTLSTTSP